MCSETPILTPIIAPATTGRITCLICDAVGKDIKWIDDKKEVTNRNYVLIVVINGNSH
ncbi:MAG: hypothetical protein ACXAEX_11675 [Promethearchaeota archaeon]|jgi:hypothetical protein